MTPTNKLILIIIFGFALFSIANLWEESLSKRDGEFIKLGSVSFYTSIDEGINNSKTLNKPVFMYFRSETCYWCLRFEEEALSDKNVADILNKNFVLVSVDVFKQKNAALNLGVRSTPYMIFFTKDGDEITRIPGYVTTDEFLNKLAEVMEKLKLSS